MKIKVTKEVRRLNINDNDDISKSTQKLSDPFSKDIKVFEDYVLIGCEDGKIDVVEREI